MLEWILKIMCYSMILIASIRSECNEQWNRNDHPGTVQDMCLSAVWSFRIQISSFENVNTFFCVCICFISILNFICIFLPSVNNCYGYIVYLHPLQFYHIVITVNEVLYYGFRPLSRIIPHKLWRLNGDRSVPNKLWHEL